MRTEYSPNRRMLKFAHPKCLLIQARHTLQANHMNNIERTRVVITVLFIFSARLRERPDTCGEPLESFSKSLLKENAAASK